MTPANRLSPIIQSLIAGALLLMFAGVLFVPAFDPGFKVDADSKQTLFTLVTAAVFFFIGKNTNTAERDAQTAALTQQLIAQPPKDAP